VGAAPDGGEPGLLPGAELRVASIFEEPEAGAPAASVVAIARALDWFVEERVPVVNLSLAGEGNALLALAVERAADRGLVLVAAAGNGGPQAAPAYPAAYPQVLAVTALDARLQPARDAAQGDHIDFAAPGVRVWAPGPDGGAYRSGSSYAAPFVTAAAASLLLDGGTADAAKVEQVLARRAVDLGAPGRDPVFGWGLVHSGEACSAEAARL
jgi:subtilisin family serine protease